MEEGSGDGRVERNNLNNIEYELHEELSEKKKLKITDAEKRYLINADDDDNTNVSSNTKVANRWRTSAVIVSWISILTTLSIGVAEFVVAEEGDSSAAFGLAFSAVLDVLTSTVVLWRYYKTNDTFSQKKEHISCILLGVLFVISSMGIAGKAIYGLLEGDTPDMSERGLNILIITSIATTAICVVLFIVKIVIAKNLSSWTMFTDALNSLMAAIIALSMIITLEVTEADPYLWFLDSTVGLVVSLCVLLYGLWLLMKHVPEIRRLKNYNET